MAESTHPSVSVEPLSDSNTAPPSTEPVAEISHPNGSAPASSSTHPVPPSSTEPVASSNTVSSPSSITLRPPSTKPFNLPSAHPIPPPSLSWLQGTWHVTHSTLPMWKKARNVQIKYTSLPSGQIDDQVTYQSLDSEKLKSVHGVDKPESVAKTSSSGKEVEDKVEVEGNWAWHWRGKGLLMIATSRWEVLGYGEEKETGNKWVVTYFAKTLFTPAGVDFYSSGKQGLQQETVGEIKKALSGLGNDDVGKLADEIFEIKIDGGRDGK